jgi:hypothetical protein
MRNTDNKPHLARRIKRKGPIFTKGQFPSHKNQKTLYFESYLELAALLYYENDPRVIFIDTQPISIMCNLKMKMTRYTPDLFIICINQDGQELRIYIEIKPAIKLEQPDNIVKFDTIGLAFEKLGKKFELFDGSKVPRTRLKNLELLFQGASVFKDNPHNINGLLDEFPNEITVAELGQLLTKLNLHENTFHYLLFEQYFSFDLDEKLNNDTLLISNVT